MAQGPEGREDGEPGALGLQTGGRVKGRQRWGLWSLRLTKKLWVQPGGAAHSQLMGQARAPSEYNPGHGCFQPGPSCHPRSALAKCPPWNASRDLGREVGVEDISDARPCFPKTL